MGVCRDVAGAPRADEGKETARNTNPSIRRMSFQSCCNRTAVKSCGDEQKSVATVGGGQFTFLSGKMNRARNST